MHCCTTVFRTSMYRNKGKMQTDTNFCLSSIQWKMNVGLSVCAKFLGWLFSTLVGEGIINRIQNFIKTVAVFFSLAVEVNAKSCSIRLLQKLWTSKTTLRSFPCPEYHYSQTKNMHKKYLSSLLSLKKMKIFI